MLEGTGVVKGLPVLIHSESIFHSLVIGCIQARMILCASHLGMLRLAGDCHMRWRVLLTYQIFSRDVDTHLSHFSTAPAHPMGTGGMVLGGAHVLSTAAGTNIVSSRINRASSSCRSSDRSVWSVQLQGVR